MKKCEEKLSSESLMLAPAMFSVSLVETQHPPDESHFLVPCTHLVLCYFSLEAIYKPIQLMSYGQCTRKEVYCPAQHCKCILPSLFLLCHTLPWAWPPFNRMM